ncbi:unnamed protein product, partial [Laminaria digitata]
TLSYANALNKRRLFFAGAVAQQKEGRLPRRVIFGAIAGGENPRPGGQWKAWRRCLVEDLKAFGATDGSTERCPLVLGVETTGWSTAAKNAGK